MRDLKVVQDWLATGSQVQSALAPFTLERNNQRIDVLGAYATARLDAKSRLGVIAVQDERTALSSVADMRRETRNIGLFAAAVTLLIGFFFANQLTQPVLELAEAAHRIAAGDFRGASASKVALRSATSAILST